MVSLWLKLAIAALLAPFGIILSPIALFFYSTAVCLNIASAGQWTPWRMLFIARRIVRDVAMVVSLAPLFKGVLWGYWSNSKDSGRLQAKKNVAFERHLEEDLAARGVSLVCVPRFSRDDMKTFREHQMQLDVFPLMPVSGVRTRAPRVRPVIVFVYGGYFDSGDKSLYNRLARQLRDHCNAVVVVPNYPTYPRGTAQEMSETIARCLMWTADNAEKYGGSRDHIWLVGHSAGAYLSAYTLVRGMMAKASGSNALPPQLMAQGRCDAPIYPLSLAGRAPYVGCKTHQRTHEGAQLRPSDEGGVAAAAAAGSTLGAIAEALAIDGQLNSDGSTTAAIKHRIGGGGRGSAAGNRCNDPTRMPNPSTPAVDYRLLPRVSGCVLLAGVYDLAEQLRHQQGIAMERTSALTAATGGYWDATNVLALVRAMAADTAVYPLEPAMCPASGFHIVHGNSDDVCPVGQSLALRDALLELELAQNEALSQRGGPAVRLTPTPPQLQTPFAGSFAAAHYGQLQQQQQSAAQFPQGGGYFPSFGGAHHFSRQNSLQSSDGADGGDIASNLPSPNTVTAPRGPYTNGLRSVGPDSPTVDAPEGGGAEQPRGAAERISLCPHGVRHTDCTHSGIVIDSLRMTGREIPYKSSTIAAIFSAIYGRPILAE